jgi:hypothetical protein
MSVKGRRDAAITRASRLRPSLASPRQQQDLIDKSLLPLLTGRRAPAVGGECGSSSICSSSLYIVLPFSLTSPSHSTRWASFVKHGPSLRRISESLFCEDGSPPFFGLSLYLSRTCFSLPTFATFSFRHLITALAHPDPFET